MSASLKNRNKNDKTVKSDEELLKKLSKMYATGSDEEDVSLPDPKTVSDDELLSLLSGVFEGSKGKKTQSKIFGSDAEFTAEDFMEIEEETGDTVSVRREEEALMTAVEVQHKTHERGQKPEERSSEKRAETETRKKPLEKRKKQKPLRTKSVHSESVHSESVHSESVHSEPLYTEEQKTFELNADDTVVNAEPIAEPIVEVTAEPEVVEFASRHETVESVSQPAYEEAVDPDTEVATESEAVELATEQTFAEESAEQTFAQESTEQTFAQESTEQTVVEDVTEPTVFEAESEMFGETAQEPTADLRLRNQTDTAQIRPESWGATKDISQPMTGEGMVLEDRDIAMLIDLGYKSELVGRVDTERLLDAESDNRRISAEKNSADDVSFKTKIDIEYTDKSQIDQVKKYNRHKLVFPIIRSAVIALITFLMILSVSGNVDPRINYIVSVSGLLISAFLCIKKLAGGFVSVCTFSLNKFSSVSVTTAGVLLYNVVMIVACALGRILYYETVYNILAVTFILIASICDCIEQIRVTYVFSRISSGKNIYALEDVSELLRAKNENGSDDKLFKVKKVSRIDGFFSSFNPEPKRQTVYGILVLSVLFLAFGAAITKIIMVGKVYNSVISFMNIFIVGVPACFILPISVSALVSAIRIGKEGCAVVGEWQASEYSGGKNIVIRDSDIFRLKSYGKYSPKSEGNVKKYLALTNKLFTYLGGTFKDLVSPNYQDDGKEPDIRITTANDDGMVLYMDSVDHIMIGNSSFMARAGIDIPLEEKLFNGGIPESAKTLYVAVNKKLRICLIASVELREDFVRLYSGIGEYGIGITVDSSDPLISEEELRDVLLSSGISLKVLRPEAYESSKRERPLVSRIVATGRGENIIYPMIACENSARIMRIIMFITLAVTLAVTSLSLVLELLPLFTDNTIKVSFTVLTAVKIGISFFLSLIFSLVTYHSVTRRVKINKN